MFRSASSQREEIHGVPSGIVFALHFRCEMGKHSRTIRFWLSQHQGLGSHLTNDKLRPQSQGTRLRSLRAGVMPSSLETPEGAGNSQAPTTSKVTIFRPHGLVRRPEGAALGEMSGSLTWFGGRALNSGRDLKEASPRQIIRGCELNRLEPCSFAEDRERSWFSEDGGSQSTLLAGKGVTGDLTPVSSGVSGPHL